MHTHMHTHTHTHTHYDSDTATVSSSFTFKSSRQFGICNMKIIANINWIAIVNCG